MSSQPTLVVLRKRAEFLAVSASGKKWVAPSFIFQYTEAKGEQSSLQLRYGLTASTKVGNAVVRNRARRRLRALAHDVLLTHAKLGYDFVLIARKDMEKFSYEDLKKDFLRGLKRLDLLKTSP